MFLVVNSTRIINSASKLVVLSFLLLCNACGSGSNDDVKNVLDQTPPVISLNGLSTITLEVGDSYQEQGASALDNVDGEIGIVITSDVNVLIPGVYQITYSAVDSAGNSATVQRAVNLTDTTAPVITILGASTVTLEAGTSYQELGVETSDNSADPLSLEIDNSFNTKALGFYTITYTATDSSGNTNSQNRTVQVIDTTSPILTLNGQSVVTVIQGKSYTEHSAEAADNAEGDIALTTTGNVDTHTPGEYFITYSAQDASGNASSITRQVNITLPRPFITKWQTNNQGATDDDQVSFSVPLLDQEITVDWGDGTQQTNVSGDLMHTYASEGVYVVTLTGAYDSLYQFQVGDDANKLVAIEQWGDINWSTMDRAFAYSENLIITASDTPDLSEVTSMYAMFIGATNLQLDASAWDVSNVTTMVGVFRQASGFNSDLSQWDVSKAEFMNNMFFGATSFDSDLSQWDVSSVKSTEFMFYQALSFSSDLSQWDVSNVTNMQNMFSQATLFDSDLSQWNVANVSKMSGMFSKASAFNSDLSQWNVSKVTFMDRMFLEASKFTSDLSQWDVSKVINMEIMFAYASKFESDLSQWDVSSVTSMRSLFAHAQLFNSDLSEWDVSKVTDMNAMFQSADAFDGDLSFWDIRLVKDLDNMFANVTLSTANYDALLLSWSEQSLVPKLKFNAGLSQYSSSSEAARNKLINTHGWALIDGGKVNN